MFALILLLIVVLVWIGSSIYFQNSNVNINPNANSYTNQISNKFDLTELGMITERTDNSFPVSPSEFTVLIQKN